jgi:hypothetical protein
LSFQRGGQSGLISSARRTITARAMLSPRALPDHPAQLDASAWHGVE